MKKKIVIGLSIFSLIFFIGGIYIIFTIENTTASLDNLIKLHQVEILREHLLIQIKRVQSDLGLKGTRYARTIDTIVTDVRNMTKVNYTCFSCHHSKEVKEKLDDLKNHIGTYRDALSRVFTIRANIERLTDEEDNAFKVGEELIAKVNTMVALTNTKLTSRTQSALKDISNTKNMLFFLVSIGPLLTIALAFIFIRGITNPINTLLSATRKLKGGNLDHRVEKLKDEFGELAVSFNEMAGSLKEQMLKMQRTEQMAVLGELAAGLAHEIKNPLAGIKASMEVLSEELNVSEDDKAVMLRVIEEIRRIESLLKDLLNFARPPKPQLTIVDINKLLDTAISFSLKSNHDSLKVFADKDESLPITIADPMQLKQVFLNLLLNAVDSMPDGGELVVKTSYDKFIDMIKISITDTGKGIDQKIMDKIFQPFFTTKVKGTGLGLATSKRLIEQHGGAISVESNLDGGTKFTISLPVRHSGEIH